MNELEKEIEKMAMSIEKEPKEGFDNTFDIGRSYGIQEGANFIIDKNIHVLFAEWLGENFVKSDVMLWQCIQFFDIKFEVDEQYEIVALENYWINNIYGKE